MKKPCHFGWSLCCFLFSLVSTWAQSTPAVDFSQYRSNNRGVSVTTPSPEILQVQWGNREGNQFRVRFNLKNSAPLIDSMEAALRRGEFQSVAKSVDAKFRVTLGTRRQQAGWPYIFFDKVPANTPAPASHFSELNLTNVTVVSESSNRVKIVFSKLQIGAYSGDLTCYVYSESPLLHLQAAMVVDKPWVAYIYDVLAFADFSKVTYKDVQGTFRSVGSGELKEIQPGEPAGVKAKHRTVMGQTGNGHGTLAIFPGPHTGLYPLDRSVNYGFLQAGKGFIGTKMSYLGDNGYVPWITAEQGATQRMDGFLLISPRAPEVTLNQVLAYTHNDSYKPVAGHYTMAEHFHPEFAQARLNGKDSLTPFKETMKSLGVQILQPMEFHLNQGRMHPVNDVTNRLAELKTMYELLEQESEDNFLIIPGEEYNEFFGGHWSYMFPRPVYFTGWHGQNGRDYRQTNVVVGGVTYPQVYQVGDAKTMLRLIEEEGGIAWSSHPRIKDSQQMPDALVDTDFYRSANFMAGDWKAMPADLSKDRLGFRAFQLMDDTAQWGYKKSMLGEVDTFELDSTHEIYGNMNINYLQLPVFPSKTNWSSVVECIREGRFFTTTGEILIESWNANSEGVTATVEWYFPPAFAEITWGDGQGIHHQRLSLANEVEFGKKQISIAANLSGANWVRFEAWDVARNGAFTQIKWLKPAADPKLLPGETVSLTLIDTDTDSAVPGCDPIPENAVLSRAKLPANLTIRANTTPLIVEKLELNFDGVLRTESNWPYCLSPDVVNKGLRGCPFYDYQPTELSRGNHQISATPIRGSARGKTLTLRFSVVE